MIPNIQAAEKALSKAEKSNPSAWVQHSRYVAIACRKIAEHCTCVYDTGYKHFSREIRHNGKRARFYKKRRIRRLRPACSAMRRVGTSDRILHFGTTLRRCGYQVRQHGATVDRRKKMLEIKKYFEEKQAVPFTAHCLILSKTASEKLLRKGIKQTEATRLRFVSLFQKIKNHRPAFRKCFKAYGGVGRRGRG